MKVFVRLLLFGFFAAFSFIGFGQAGSETKSLLDSSSLVISAKPILLLETDSFVVFTPYKTFESNCKAFIKAHDVEWDVELLHLFQKYKSKKTIVASEIASSAKLKERLLYRIADLLEAGSAVVYNKTTKELEKKIITEPFTTISVAGRKFIVSKRGLVLKIEDTIF